MAMYREVGQVGAARRAVPRRGETSPPDSVRGEEVDLCARVDALPTVPTLSDGWVGATG
jgi:hypothetical protein